MKTSEQIMTLMGRGLSSRQIAASLDLDEGAVEDMVSDLSGKARKVKKTAEQLIEEFKPRCIEILYEIASDSNIENVSARVKAASVIVAGGSDIGNFNANELLKRLDQMRRVVAEHEGNVVIDINPQLEDKKEDKVINE